MVSSYVCWGKCHPQMPLFFGLYGKNEAVEWNCQKKHQFLDSHRSGEKYKKLPQILLFPPLLPKVHKLFLNWGKQDYLLEGTMVRNCLFFQTSEWELRQFWSFRGTWGKLNITFTVSINHKQKTGRNPFIWLEVERIPCLLRKGFYVV